MPNQGKRKKKAGQNKSKKAQAMRSSVKERKLRARPEEPTTDQPDIYEFKRGGPQDRTSQGRRDQR